MDTPGGPVDPDKTSILTPAEVWLVHRAALGGFSAITGDPLPETLADCKVGVQEAHYAIAVGAALRAGIAAAEVPLPPLVTAERAEKLAGVARLIVERARIAA